MTDLQHSFSEYSNKYGRSPNATQLSKYAKCRYIEASKFIKNKKNNPHKKSITPTSTININKTKNTSIKQKPLSMFNALDKGNNNNNIDDKPHLSNNNNKIQTSSQLQQNNDNNQQQISNNISSSGTSANNNLNDDILNGSDQKQITSKYSNKNKKKDPANWKPCINSPDLSLKFFANSIKLYWIKKKEMKKDLWDAFVKEYKHLSSINHNEMTDQHRKKHIHVAISSIAMYRSLKKINNYNNIEITKQITGMYKYMLFNIFRGIKNKLKRSNNAWNEFSDFAWNGTLSEYNTFEPKLIRKDNDVLFWNFNKCVFHEICIKNNEPDVAVMLCDYDNILAQFISPWITFKRDKTIAFGNTMCTFRYCKNEVVKDIEDWCM